MQEKVNAGGDEIVVKCVWIEQRYHLGVKENSGCLKVEWKVRF